MQGKPTTETFQIRSGDPLLIATAGLLGALGESKEFPQDRAGIEALVAGAAKGPNGERLFATYEAPDDLPSYLGGFGTWVAPAGEGRLRVRQPMADVDRLVSRVWILGPDGSLSDPETIEGYGVPDAELPESARAELEELERRRRDFEAEMPEMERRNEEFQNRHRVEHLLGVVAGPADQDQGGLVVSHVALYDTGLIVHYFLPRPDEKNLDSDDPWAVEKAAEHKLVLDDGLGTEYGSWTGSMETSGKGLLRCSREFTPAVPAAASRLSVKVDEMSVEIGLRPS